MRAYARRGVAIQMREMCRVLLTILDCHAALLRIPATRRLGNDGCSGAQTNRVSKIFY
jgi:hypothetical protein